MKANEHTVLITGGGSGIGLALAKRFYAEGNRLILAGRNEARLKAARAQLGPEAELYAGDVADETVIAELPRRYPEVNVLINNAGVQHMYNMLNAPDYPRQCKEELRVNLIAPALLCRTGARSGDCKCEFRAGPCAQGQRSHVLREQGRPAQLHKGAAVSAGNQRRARVRNPAAPCGHGYDPRTRDGKNFRGRTRP